WTQTTWAQHSIGITGRLLARRWSGAVEGVQLVVMAAVYGAGWISIRRGRSVLPWLAAALLAFSLTTLWPVVYVYFDVFLLFACAALAETDWVRQRSVASAWTLTAAIAIVVLLLTAWPMMPRDSTIDVGTGRDRER